MKKKLVKRLLATALVTVMTASMLVGCGGGSSDGGSASGSGTSDAADAGSSDAGSSDSGSAAAPVSDEKIDVLNQSEKMTLKVADSRKSVC